MLYTRTRRPYGIARGAYARYGDAASDAADNIAAADKAIAEMRRAYAIGQAKVAAGTLITVGSTADATAGAYAALGPLIDKWATTYKTWATNGQRDDGTAYDWDRWKDFGKTLIESLNYYIANLWDSNAVTAAWDAIKQTASDVGSLSLKVANPLAWPLSVKLGVGFAGLLGAAYVWRTFIGKRR